MTYQFKPSRHRGLERAPGYCPKCGALGDTLYWIPKSRNGNRGRWCKLCDDVNFKPVTGEVRQH